MTERERQILALLRDDPTLSAAAIARRLKTSAAAVTVHLERTAPAGRDRRPRLCAEAGRSRSSRSAAPTWTSSARALAPMVLRTSNPGRMAATVGGVACNIARNLARLSVPTALFTVVGQDEFGERILREVRAAGIDASMTPAERQADRHLCRAAGPRRRYDRRHLRHGCDGGADGAADRRTRRRAGAGADGGGRLQPGAGRPRPPRGAVRERERAAGDRRRFHPQGRAAAAAPERRGCRSTCSRSIATRRRSWSAARCSPMRT